MEYLTANKYAVSKIFGNLQILSKMYNTINDSQGKQHAFECSQ